MLTCTHSTKILWPQRQKGCQSQDTSFMLTTWICGQEIALSLGNIAAWLEVPNEGEETYLLRGWTQMALGTADQYKTWFDRNNRGVAPVYVSNLPSLHRCSSPSLTTSSSPKQPSKPISNGVSCTIFATLSNWTKPSTSHISSFAI